MVDDRADRGQIGIETLVVFIAMILVAALAAGVLVNTAGFLQQKSETTGDQSVQSVTGRLLVVSETGLNARPNNHQRKGLDIVTFTVMKAPGSGDVNVGKITVTWYEDRQSDPRSAYLHRLVWSGDWRSAGCRDGEGSQLGYFGIVPSHDTDGSFPVLNDRSDRFQLVFDLGDQNVPLSGERGATSDDVESENCTVGHFGENIQQGETISIRITTSSGATTYTILRAPDSLHPDEDAVSL